MIFSMYTRQLQYKIADYNSNGDPWDDEWGVHEKEQEDTLDDLIGDDE